MNTKLIILYILAFLTLAAGITFAYLKNDVWGWFMFIFVIELTAIGNAD